MKKVTIQTKNVDIEVKRKADEVAKKAGFGGLNDAIRLFVADLASGELYITQPKIENKALKARIRQALKEYEEGRYTILDPNRSLSDQILNSPDE
jgi:antitoxin component of RelBE/YafQ-DinJ toxin-antitoxin module